MRRLVAAVAAVGILATACSQTTSGTPGGGGTGAAPAAASQYGAAVEAGKGVTYQSDVVIIPNGPAAVRGVGEGGLIWYLDPAAPGVADLAEGKIMFATGRGVGRIVDVRDADGARAVTIVPIPLTDIIKDGTFTGTSPVSLADVSTYDAGNPSWAPADDPAAPSPQPAPSGTHSLAGALAAVPPQLPPPSHDGSIVKTVLGVKVQATCCDNGAGIVFDFFRDQFKASGSLTVTMNRPSVNFTITVAGGAIKIAELAISGGVGLRAQLDGATEIFANLKRDVELPVDFSVPIGTVLGVPLSATVHQSFTLQTDFHAKDGNIHATGEWSFSGGLGFQYHRPYWAFDAPHTLVKKKSILDSLQGISIGVNGMSASYDVKVTVGIGAWGLTIGPYFGLHVSVGVARGSAAGAPIAECNSATVAIYAKYGVGFTLPKALVRVINFILEKLDQKPIKESGGIGQNTRTYSKTAYSPDTHICTGK